MIKETPEEIKRRKRDDKNYDVLCAIYRMLVRGKMSPENAVYNLEHRAHMKIGHNKFGVETYNNPRNMVHNHWKKAWS